MPLLASWISLTFPLPRVRMTLPFGATRSWLSLGGGFLKTVGPGLGPGCGVGWTVVFVVLTGCGLVVVGFETAVVGVLAPPVFVAGFGAPSPPASQQLQES